MPEEISPERPGMTLDASAREIPRETKDPDDPDFDETTYLRAFPDIADAVRRGILESGLAHFRQTGRTEKRLEKAEYRALLAAHAGPAPPQVAVDTLTISRSGSTLMTGWSDDRFDKLTEINLETRPAVRHNWLAFPRLVRADVERTLDAAPGDAAPGHRFGFLLVAAPVGDAAGSPFDPRTANAPAFRFASGTETSLQREPAVATDADLRDLALAALSTAAPGELDPEVIFGILDQHVGVQIAAINRLIIEQARARRLTERFGPSRTRFRGSIITVLRGGAEQIVPRLALVGGGPGGDEYEFIVVVTNADQFEPALRAARIAQATIGLSLTIVLQPSGDPAGTGEDAAGDIARSDRLIFMDQAVLPRDPGWASHHSALLDDIPPPPPPDITPEAGKPNVVYVPGAPVCDGKCVGKAPAELGQALQQRANMARRCYNAALAQDSSLKGHVSIAVRVAPGGSVCSAAVAANDTGNSSVAQCAANAFRTGSYPSPAGGCVDATIPLSFVPMGGQ